MIRKLKPKTAILKLEKQHPPQFRQGSVHYQSSLNISTIKDNSLTTATFEVTISNGLKIQEDKNKGKNTENACVWDRMIKGLNRTISVEMSSKLALYFEGRDRDPGL